MNDITIIFNKEPSALYTLWKAFRSRKSLYSAIRPIPVIRVKRSNIAISRKHLYDFYEICNISPSAYLHIMYPFTLVFPYLMRVLCTKEIPLNLFRSMNTRNSILMRRAVSPDEHVDIDCHNAALRIVPRGLEIDIKSDVVTGGKTVWEIISTFFYPGKFGIADPSYTAPRLNSISDAPVIKEWHFPAKNRFRFARVSGDTNGIHYGSFYARMMGFERDFAQPIRVVAECVSSLPALVSQGPCRLDFHLKGQVYYERVLTLKNIQTKNCNRFDLYCSGNERPCICGSLSYE